MMTWREYHLDSAYVWRVWTSKLLLLRSSNRNLLVQDVFAGDGDFVKILLMHNIQYCGL